MSFDDDDILCNNSGKCEAPLDARGVTNCIHCGKELHEKDGKWFTWDADIVTKWAKSQSYVIKKEELERNTSDPKNSAF